MATKKTSTALEPDLVEMGNEPQRPIRETPTPVQQPGPSVSPALPREGSQPFEQLLGAFLGLAAAAVVVAATEATYRSPTAGQPAFPPPKTRRTRRWRNLR